MLITCYMALGDKDGVRRVAQRTLAAPRRLSRRKPTTVPPWQRCSRCLLALGETERAKEMARRAVLIDPDNLNMRYNMACDLVVNLRDFEARNRVPGPGIEEDGPGKPGVDEGRSRHGRAAL